MYAVSGLAWTPTCVAYQATELGWSPFQSALERLAFAYLYLLLMLSVIIKLDACLHCCKLRGVHTSATCSSAEDGGMDATPSCGPGLQHPC